MTTPAQIIIRIECAAPDREAMKAMKAMKAIVARIEREMDVMDAPELRLTYTDEFMGGEGRITEMYYRMIPQTDTTNER